jgi:hypothetical protein
VPVRTSFVTVAVVVVVVVEDGEVELPSQADAATAIINNALTLVLVMVFELRVAPRSSNSRCDDDLHHFVEGHTVVVSKRSRDADNGFLTEAGKVVPDLETCAVRAADR